jgi:tetratricopeptide (TPR) repeat protein
VEDTIKTIIFVIILVSSVIISVGLTNYFISQTNEAEIDDLKNGYETQIQLLSSELTSYQTTNDNFYRYTKNLAKGFEQFYLAKNSDGYADADYDSAGLYYEENFFSDAKIFADSADVFYGYATIDYSDAESYFDSAFDYAISDNYMQLASLYSNLSAIHYELSNEMHQANEYFSSACNYYDQGYYDIGGDEIDRMNDHIENHDDLIPAQNDIVSDIETLLDNFY